MHRLWPKSLETCPTERDLGVLVDDELNVSEQCVLAAKRVNCPLGIALSCVRGGSGWVLGKGSSPEGGGHGTGSPGQWSHPQAAGDQEAFVQCSQTKSLDFGWFCREAGAELSDPEAFISSQDIL